MLEGLSGGGGGSADGTSLGVSIIGSGNAITDVNLVGSMLSFSKGTVFVEPSNFMSYLKYNSDTLGLNANGELYVKVSTGGSGGDADLSQYATKTWVNSQGFLKQSSLADYATIDYVDELVSNLGGGSDGGGSGDFPDLSAYAEKTWVDENFASNDWVSSNFASLEGNNTFSGTNKFNGSVFVNNKEIKYNSKGYWELDGDLLVTGGITSFASSSGFTPSTIMDGVAVDGVTIIKQDGKLVVVGGGSSGGVADYVAWGNILDKPSWIGDDKPSYSYSEISGTPDLSKYLTSHQTIYDLTFQSGEFTADTFDPNGSQKTIKIPTTTAHISESSNSLYFTNERAVAALKDTLSYYVDLTNEQEIEGRKNFTGGLLVNGQELVYNDDGYWKMEGNLLVTGGITSYSSDGKATPFLIDADTWEGITSDSTTQVYSAKAVTLLKNEVQSVGVDADSALAKLEIIKEELSTLTESSLTTAIRTALLNIKEKI
jgi:hypothetical protein